MSPAQRYQAVELIGFAALAFLVVVALCFYRRLPDGPTVLGTYLGLIASIEAMNRAHRRFRQWAVVRVLYRYWPVTTVLIIFMTLHMTIPFVNPLEKDEVVRRFDLWLFGLDPAVWVERFLHPFWVDFFELFYALYFYYPLIILTMLYTANRPRAFERAAAAMGITLFSSYVCYFLIPVVGPRRNPAIHFARPLEGLYLHEHAHEFLNSAELTIHNCFPSAHTSLSLVVVLLAWRFHRPLFWMLLVPVLALIAATIFLRYHYFADLAAGVASAVVSLWLAERLVRRLERARARGAPGNEPEA